jgi:GTPase
LLLIDINDNWQTIDELFTSFKLKVPSFLLINKIDKAKPEKIQAAQDFFKHKKYAHKIFTVSALEKQGINEILEAIINILPEGMAFYNEDDLTDLPTKFFVSELIREQIFILTDDELPYHSTVLVNAFQEKTTLIKIQADIVVQRETQKAIIIGEGGKKIKAIGANARQKIEAFLGQKVFLELFVKVRPKWRDNDMHLKEYGY